MEWIKIDSDNPPPQMEYVICSDGETWRSAYVTPQFEFAPNKDSKQAYVNVTHFCLVTLPKTK